MFKTKAITGANVPWNFPYIFEPKSYLGNPPKYSVQMIIPKSDKDTIKNIRAAMQEAYKEFVAQWNLPNIPEFNEFQIPLHDGDLAKLGNPMYANAFFITANSDTAPLVYDHSGSIITDPSAVYPGVYGRVHVNMRAYNYNGTLGISCHLLELQKSKRTVAPNQPPSFKSAFACVPIEDDFNEDFDEDFENIEVIG